MKGNFYNKNITLILWKQNSMIKNLNNINTSHWIWFWISLFISRPLNLVYLNVIRPNTSLILKRSLSNVLPIQCSSIFLTSSKLHVQHIINSFIWYTLATFPFEYAIRLFLTYITLHLFEFKYFPPTILAPECVKQQHGH